MLALDCVNWAPAVYAKPPHCTAAGRRHPLPPRAPPPAAAASGVFCCCRHLLSSSRVCQRAPQSGADNQRRGWHAAQPAAAADARRAPRPCGGGRGGRAAGCGDRWEQWEGSSKGKGGQQGGGGEGEEGGKPTRIASPRQHRSHAGQFNDAGLLLPLPLSSLPPPLLPVACCRQGTGALDQGCAAPRWLPPAPGVCPGRLALHEGAAGAICCMETFANPQCVTLS